METGMRRWTEMPDRVHFPVPLPGLDKRWEKSVRREHRRQGAFRGFESPSQRQFDFSDFEAQS